MAASAATASSPPGLCPNYAVICSFLERYGALLDLPELTFPQLERYLRDTSSVPKLLVDLHVKLLRKIGKSVSADRWEKYLVKVCQEFNSTWAWELEEKGYKELTMDCKTGILKYLCECQFDENVKFKTAINDEDPDKMRLQPIGRDKDGQMYWFHLDQDNNVRVYVEEQDDLDGSSWKCIVRDRSELAEVVALLKTQIDPELLKRDQEKKAEAEKAEGDAKKTEDTSDEDSRGERPVPQKTEGENSAPSDGLKPEPSEDKPAPVNGVIEDKPEAEVRRENDGAKAPSIKEEPMETSDRKAETLETPPPPSTHSEAPPCLSVKAEKEGGVKKSSAEEIQQSLKNDQQAKIPLKKRGMKFCEDFEKSSAVVTSASLKEAPKAGPAHAPPEPAKSVSVNGELQTAAEKVGERTTESGKREANEVDAADGSKRKDVCVRDKDADVEKKSPDGLPEVSKANESPPPPKDTNDAADKPSNHKPQDQAKESAPTESGETPDPTEKLQSNHDAASKESEKSERPSERVDAETAESNPSEGAKTSGRRGDAALEETGRSREESEEPKEKSDVAAETPSTGSAPLERRVPPETAASLPVGTETGDASAGEKGAAEERTAPPAASESSRPADVKETETKTETPKDVKEAVNCEDVKTQDVHKVSDSTSEPMEEEESGKQRGEDKAETDVQKTSEETSEKGHEASCPPKDKNVSEEGGKEEEKMETESEKVSEVRAGEAEAKSSTAQSEKDTEEDGEKDKEEGTKDKGNKSEEKTSEDTKTKNREEENRKEETVKKPGEDSKTEDKEEGTKDKGDKSKTDTGEEKTSEDTKTKNTDEENGKEENVKKPGENSKTEDKDKEDKEDKGDKKPPDETKDKDKQSKKDADVKKPSGDLKTKTKGEEDNKEESGEKPAEDAKDRPSQKDEDVKTPSQETKDKDEQQKNSANVEKPPEETKDEDEQNKTEEKESERKDESKDAKAVETKDETDENKTEASQPKDPDASKGGTKKEATSEAPSDKAEKAAPAAASPAAKDVENGVESLVDTQVADIRRKNRTLAHRRKAELLREERHGDSESDTNAGTAMSLRRSPRISRPTPKAVEIQDKKMEKTQAASTPPKSRDGEKEEDEEEEEEEEVKAVQKKPREKKADQEGQSKPKGRKRRKMRWSNTRSRRKKKDSEDENSEEESSEDDDSEEEEEDDSDEDYKVERTRKRRGRNRERRSSDSSTSTDDDLPPNDDPCKHCGLPNHPELILLCDSCDSGYHTACLRPPLMIIPDGEWFCPPCQHKMLCDKLEEQLLNLDAALKKKERAERRKERLIYVGISLENIITPSVEEVEEEKKPEILIKEKKEAKRSKSWGRRSTRAKKTISYRFDEFDEAIEEAIEEDIKEAEGGGAGRGKDMANITGHRGKDISTILQAEGGKENGRPPRPSAAQRRKKRRRLNDLDSDSTVDEEESEEEFRLSDSSEEEFIASDNATEVETEPDDSDFGSDGSGRRHASSRSRRPVKCRRSSRKRRRPRGYSDDEEEESDEEEEDEIVTEGSSEFSDSDLDMSRRRSRRSHKKAVNYCETSESDGSQAETNRPKMKPRRQRESSESEASFSRDSSEEPRDRRPKRRGDSSEEDSRQRRRRLALKRRRASEEDDSDDDSDSSEEDRPVRKRVNRIDSDDDDEEEEQQQQKKEEEEEEEEEQKPKEKKPEEEEESKDTTPSGGKQAELPPTNGQGAIKTLEGRPPTAATAAPGAVPLPDTPKNVGAAPAGAVAPNGLAAPDVSAPDDDEDDLLGVTDLVDYVCNNEDL